MAFLISTFLLQQFPRYQGVPNLHQGSLCPLDTPSRYFCTQTEYFTISSSVFNFNFLALVVFETLGQSQIYTRRPAPPSGKIFIPSASTLSYLIVLLISTFQLLYFPIYQGCPKFTLGGPAPHGRPQQKNFCTQGEYFTISNGIYNSSFLALVVSEILGSHIYIRGHCTPRRPPGRKILTYA